MSDVAIAVNNECGACRFGPGSWYCQSCDRKMLGQTITTPTDYDENALRKDEG